MLSRSTLKLMSRVLLVFGVVCYFTSCAMDFNEGVRVSEQVPASGGVIGPIEVQDGGTVLDVEVQQQIDGSGRTFRRWSFVTVELLDADRQYLTGFGGEFWREAGYDEGYWEEADETYENKVTVPEAGRYFLRLQTESDVSAAALSPIQVDVRAKVGSSLPHHVAAILALVAGALLWWMSIQNTDERTSSMRGRP